MSSVIRMADFLAGRGARQDGSRLAGAEEVDALARHARRMDERFRRFEAGFADPFSRWVEANLDTAPKSRAIFYPMSGPDIFFPLRLDPQAEEFVLCGLEPCGSIVDPQLLDGRQLADLLDRIEESTRHFLDHSYFVTADMRDHLQDPLNPGILPLLLLLLVRSDGVVESVRPCPLGDRAGISIEFRHRGARKRLRYFQQDLRDPFFSPAHPLFDLVAGLGSPTVFLKSASYLLHEPYFSTLTRLLLDHSSTIVQDPSSVPFRSLRGHGWNVDLHGSYSGTVSIFSKYEQPDLIEAYRGEPARHLDFGFSYLKRPEIASLMVATPGRRGEGVDGAMSQAPSSRSCASPAP